MSVSTSGFNQPATADSSPENVHGAVDQPSAVAEGTKKKPLSQQPRQLLSCTKCRERKVKVRMVRRITRKAIPASPPFICDRTKPCTSCCARGQPKDCHFKVAEGGDYAPIQQSYELRKLRTENIQLKNRLRQSNLPIEADEEDFDVSPDSHLAEVPVSKSHRRRAARQRRFQGSEWSDSIYFGSPALANVITEFANISLSQVSGKSITHAMPRGADMYAPQDIPAYPFPTVFPAEQEACITRLLQCLPEPVELSAYLDSFQDRVQICAFPHVPVEVTKSEVDRFLGDARTNVQICPDMLALLFATLALGAQHCVWDKYGGKWVAGAMEKELKNGDVYMAASMQALRMASFMSKPTLLSIQALIMIGPYLTNSGRFLDAWTLFGTTIRLAQSIGLHRHPKYLDPAPPTEKECSIRQSLWWWMLHMDQQYSMTLGRPLGISGIGDCPPPHELTTDPTILRFGEFVHRFTILARQILSSDRLTNTKIDEFTDRLRALLDTMPENLQFNESWLCEDKPIPDWPHGPMAAAFYCKIHNYLILLNRQRLDKQESRTSAHQTPSPITKTPPPSFHSGNHPPSSHPSPTLSSKATLRGRALVLASSEDLLTAFLFFKARVSAALICWTMGQQAFNSCMILVLDALETHDLSRIKKVEQAHAIFQELHTNGVHKLAGIAVGRVSWGLNQLLPLRDEVGVSMVGESAGLVRAGHEGDVQMQGAAGNEVADPGTLQDSVMGNTGMNLLENSGLQSFHREAFTPLSWDWAGDRLQGVSPLERKQQEEQDQRKLCEPLNPGSESDEEFNNLDKGFCTLQEVRSSEEVQGLRRSALGSAPLRFATACPAPSQAQSQPQGLVSPISPLSSTTLMQQPQHQFQGIGVGLHQQLSPHPRHHSYPSLHQHIPPRPVPHSSPQSNNPTLYSQSQPSPVSTLSHCSPSPALRSSQIRSGTLSHQQPCHVTNANNASVHPSWAARPAPPISRLSEPEVFFAQVPAPARVQDIPAQHIQQSPNPTYPFPFSYHMVATGSRAKANVATTAVTQAGLDQMDTSGWRR
ncbi:uncharacterized protein BDR25DRAFT_289297 [Lindgomyces ingoldianus]|uniref:Uncharacterized protein n=1 Tax=Lindgomyces ingoldianus TaxID=673940 RepID=A0ACB6QQ40_9PLEO|nr:uncharacterized protein BDR25DRAFT_289297 [Lindgomyces ingoldianus]KAF2469104.1 hypothetical protein BDR25DRAFT_289297 [Lindgomyces ingoldianus]